jgi:DNA polymerase III subunit delta
MRVQELFQELERGRILPLYYFYGPEKWLIEEALGKIKEKVLSPVCREFDSEVLDGEEQDAGKILGSLQTYPLRSSRRFVMIRRADFLWGKNPSPFIDYFAHLNPQTCAVFLGERADFRHSFFGALEKKGAVVSFAPLSEKEVMNWLSIRARRVGLTVTPQAILLLIDRVGTDLRELEGAVQKLALGQGAKREIGEEDILESTADIREESPFELPRAVGHMNLGKMVRLLQKNLEQGESPLLLLALITRQLRLLRKAQELRARGDSVKEVEKKLRIFPRIAKDFWEQVDRFPPSVFEKLWPITWRVDQNLKSSRLEKGLWLEEYLWGIYFRAGGNTPPLRGRPGATSSGSKKP